MPTSTVNPIPADLVLIQEDTSKNVESYCHEWQNQGDIQPFWGFGETPKKAKEQSIYTESDRGWGRSLGFGDWEVKTSVYENRNGWGCYQLVELIKDGIVISSFNSD